MIERLRRGDEVDVEAESPPLPTGKITEIASVAQAFSTVQRTAVEAAVGQADLRKGVNQVFLNLSLRNQSLLHRQLGMLDSMERATNEPSALADLFRLDHLTTRMRRHAEGLIILSGATPGRGWRDPVPVLDVLRAAIAEVEDYVRVDAASDSRDSVVGAAVNDVIHLVAELVENATTFSPPTTRVEIRADVVGNGFAVEIEDRGLGLAPAELADINARLASPPEFDLANSDQLGLFVVGQLAARHGIRVSLRESPYGGTTAIVLMPHSVIVREGETRSRGSASGTGQPAPAGRPRLLSPRMPRPPPARWHRPDRAPGADLRVQPDGTAPAGSRSPAERDRAGPGPRPVLRRARRPVGRAGGTGGRGQPGARALGSRAAGACGAARSPRRCARTWPGGRRPRPRKPTGDCRGGSARPASPPSSATTTAAEPAASRMTGPPIEARSPDETRNLFSSLQQGWQRGRVDDLDYPDDGPGEWPGGRPGGSPDSGNGEAL